MCFQYSPSSALNLSQLRCVEAALRKLEVSLHMTLPGILSDYRKHDGLSGIDTNSFRDQPFREVLAQVMNRSKDACYLLLHGGSCPSATAEGRHVRTSKSFASRSSCVSEPKRRTNRRFPAIGVKQRPGALFQL